VCQASIPPARGRTRAIPRRIFPDVPASLELWGALRGRTWSGGMALSTTELIAFVRALQGLASK
jgi:hypothetical protein